MSASTWLTQESYDRLSAELEELSGPARVDIAKKIEMAREEGDLKENGGYHAAREELGKIDGRIQQLVDMLERAKVGGRNRVEQVELLPRLISIEEATRLLNTDFQGFEKLVADGQLDPVNAGRHVRLERQAVQALARAPG